MQQVLLQTLGLRLAAGLELGMIELITCVLKAFLNSKDERRVFKIIYIIRY